MGASDDDLGPPAGYVIFDPSDPFEVRAGPFYGPRDAAAEPHFVFRAGSRHCNSAGVVHGGLLMTFADLALCAIALQDRAGERAITVDFNARFVAAGRVGDLVDARGEVLRRTGSLVFVRGRVSASDRTLITASAVVKRVPRD